MLQMELLAQSEIFDFVSLERRKNVAMFILFKHLFVNTLFLVERQSMDARQARLQRALNQAQEPSHANQRVRLASTHIRLRAYYATERFFTGLSTRGTRHGVMLLGHPPPDQFTTVNLQPIFWSYQKMRISTPGLSRKRKLCIQIYGLKFCNYEKKTSGIERQRWTKQATARVRRTQAGPDDKQVAEE
jgi:hypothetical protein